MTNVISETQFKERVLKDLKALEKTWTLKTQEVARHGVPDVLICKRGGFIAIELKRDNEKPTPLQAHVIKLIREADGLAFYSTPSMWESHLRMLKELK
jgi:RecB family endonuclease NucS